MRRFVKAGEERHDKGVRGADRECTATHICKKRERKRECTEKSSRDCNGLESGASPIRLIIVLDRES